MFVGECGGGDIHDAAHTPSAGLLLLLLLLWSFSEDTRSPALLVPCVCVWVCIGECQCDLMRGEGVWLVLGIEEFPASTSVNVHPPSLRVSLSAYTFVCGMVIKERQSLTTTW